jgi:hypothetical protein
MTKYFIFILIIFCSTKGFGQYKTVDECKNNQEIEKKLVVSEKLTHIEVIQYFKNNTWTPVGKNVYYFNSDGQLTKMVIIDIDKNGIETEKWSGKYIYNISGLCDSLPTDKEQMIKATNPLAMYPTCYQHIGHKKLTDGLVIKIKYPKTHNQPTKVAYHFKRD